MNAPTDNVTPSQPVLMRLLVRSWEYRHPRVWVRVRFAAGIWNLFLGVFLLGVFLLASGYQLRPLAWVAALPLAGAALLFSTGSACSTPSRASLQHPSQVCTDADRDDEQSRYSEGLRVEEGPPEHLRRGLSP